MPQELLLIGQVALATDLSVKTIRYYADLGLIPTHDRTEGGFRVFTPEVLGRLAFIKRAQRLGMTLHDIAQVLTIRDQGSPPCHAIHELLHEKVAEIDQRIQELQVLRQQLHELLADWQDPDHLEADQICPNLENHWPVAASVPGRMG
ncbi:MAG: hypothetical protein OHK0012_14380 [Synechococcales cyanobacterium]